MISDYLAHKIREYVEIYIYIYNSLRHRKSKFGAQEHFKPTETGFHRYAYKTVSWSEEDIITTISQILEILELALDTNIKVVRDAIMQISSSKSFCHDAVTLEFLKKFDRNHLVRKIRDLLLFIWQTENVSQYLINTSVVHHFKNKAKS